MPRAGQVKPPVQERLSDRIAIGVLTSTYPPELVGPGSRRGRPHPAAAAAVARPGGGLAGAGDGAVQRAGLRGGRPAAGGWAGVGQALAAVVPGALDAGD